MTDVSACRGKRVYHFGMPFHVPGIWMGIAVTKLKQLGVWDKLPDTLRQRAKVAKASWSGLAITERDLDAIPDHDWEEIAARLNLKWEIR
jgi:hypothetical protein